VPEVAERGRKTRSSKKGSALFYGKKTMPKSRDSNQKKKGARKGGRNRDDVPAKRKARHRRDTRIGGEGVFGRKRNNREGGGFTPAGKEVSLAIIRKMNELKLLFLQAEITGGEWGEKDSTSIMTSLLHRKRGARRLPNLGGDAKA